MQIGEIREVRIERRDGHPQHAFRLSCPECQSVIYLHELPGRISTNRRACQRCRWQYRVMDAQPDGSTWIARTRAIRRLGVRDPNRAARANRRDDARPIPAPQPRTAVTAQTRRFGCELEIANLPMNRAAMAVATTGLACREESYSHSTPTQWKVVRDGSVYGGSEVVSPPLAGQAGLDQLKQACEGLTQAGGGVNRSCGYHVHVEVRDLTPIQVVSVVRYFQRLERVIDLFVSPSRRQNYYCASLRHLNLDGCSSLDGLATRFNRGRYFKLNVMSLFRQGTLEFRVHQGTVDSKKATMWVRLLLALIDDVVNGTECQQATVSSFLANKDQDVREYFTGRARTFLRGANQAEYASAAA